MSQTIDRPTRAAVEPRRDLTTPGRRLVGIDYLRAVLSLAVVAWHLKLFGMSKLFDVHKYNPARYRVHASDIANFDLLLLAVPAFILISNYLLARREPTWADLRRQLGRVAVLAVFWQAAYVVWEGGHGTLVTLVNRFINAPVRIIVTANYTIYYFFPILLATLVLTYVLSKLPTAVSVAVAVGGWACLAVFPAVRTHYPDYPLCAFWQPHNFLAYPALAVLVHRRLAARAVPWGLVLLAAGALVAVAEWYYTISPATFATESFGMPAYTRPSLPLLSTGLLLFCLLPGWRPNAVVSFMSRHSLALYCLHLFAADCGLVEWAIGPLHLAGEAWVVARYTATVLLSYAFSVVMTLFLQPRLVR